jgi:flavin-binding protein dodecin
MGNLVKVIEVIAQSEKGFDDAARQAVKEAAKTIHGIRSIWIDNLTATVEGNRITEYRANAKISFVVDEKR